MGETSDNFSVVIVTPTGTKVEYNVRHLQAPGSEGDFGVLRGHLPFMTGLRIGTLRLDTEQGQQIWATSGGYAEVLSDQVTILAETAENSSEIDLDRANAAKERALGRLGDSGGRKSRRSIASTGGCSRTSEHWTNGSRAPAD